MGTWVWRSGEDTDRAVSNVLGVVLVVSVVLIGVVATVGFGVTGLVGTTTELGETAAERDLVGLAQAVDETTIYRGASSERGQFDLATAEVAGDTKTLQLDDRSGSLALSIRNGSSERRILHTSLGRVEYTNTQSDARIAYQSGLVSAAPTASETPGVVQTNGFAYRTDAGVHGIMMHPTRLTGSETLTDDVTIRETDRRVLFQEGMLSGADELVMRITSTYSDSWAIALRDIFPASHTTITSGDGNEESSRDGKDELVLIYDVPDEGAFLRAVFHEVTLDD